jgi:hypothetical protein
MMRYPATTLDRPTTYRATQHDTLNFEACGGEHWSSDDLELRPDAKVIPFPARIARRVITLNHRKETPMSKKNSVPKEPQSRRSTTSALERRETFVASGPVLATVTSRSGNVNVRTTTGSNLAVSLRATSSSAHLLELAEVHFQRINRHT